MPIIKIILKNEKRNEKKIDAIINKIFFSYIQNVSIFRSITYRKNVSLVDVMIDGSVCFSNNR